MDWMEHQVPPPSWHDDGIGPEELDDGLFPLTSVVRRCYLQHLEQSLLQNHESCKIKNTQLAPLHDLILFWERNALRACMVTAIYQRAMLKMINDVKEDTKKHKLTSILRSSIKKEQHFVNVSTQTDMTMPRIEKVVSNSTDIRRTDLTAGLQPVIGKTKKEPRVNGRSSVGNSDGPFLTPPSDHSMPNIHVSKRQQSISKSQPKEIPDEAYCSTFAQNTVTHMPAQFSMPPPGYQPPSQPYYLDQVNSSNVWTETNEHNCSAEPQYDINATYYIASTLPPMVPPPAIKTELQDGHDASRCVVDSQGSIQQGTFNWHRPVNTPSDAAQVPSESQGQPSNMVEAHEGAFSQSENHSDMVKVEFSLEHENLPEPDYDWDQIEKDMARLCGQVFTEADSTITDEIEPEKKTIVEKTPPNNWEIPEDLHEAELKAKLEEVKQKWSLEKQANLKRKFIELFGRDPVDEDPPCKMTAKETAICKQNIALLVVKHLMPLYKAKRIANKHLFKRLAKHISDLLIERNLHPDECDVWMGVQEFFRDGTCFRCEADFRS